MILRLLVIIVLAGILSGCEATGPQPGNDLRLHRTAIHQGLSYSAEYDVPQMTTSTNAPVLPKLNQGFILPRPIVSSHRDWDRYVEVSSNARASCLPDKLRKIVISAAKHFGQKAMVTSAHRSARKNRKVGGARGSYHIYCQAVDMRIKGVSKSTLARFLRTLPERGGLGTYCNKSIVHIDLGPKREWHYGCRKRRYIARRSSKAAKLAKRMQKKIKQKKSARKSILVQIKPSL